MTDEKSPKMLFAEALAAFQADLPKVGKDKTLDAGKYQSKYADLADISEAAFPKLAAHGLSFSATTGRNGAGAFVLEYELLHVAGHSKTGEWELPDPMKVGSQQVGSALTYARRYAFCAATGIAPGGDDDDGKQAEATAGKPQRGKEKPADDARTDAAWLEDFRSRLVFCTTPGEVRGLWTEASDIRKDGRLAADDWTAIKGEMNARVDELKGAPDAA